MCEFPKHESINIEFKSDRKGGYPDDLLVEEIVGIANSEGGVLYLGIEDDGEVTGVVEHHKDGVGLAAMVANKTRPTISVRTELLAAGKLWVMAIYIPKSYSVMATVSGKILKRRLKADGEPEVVPMYPYELHSRLSDLRMLDFSAQPMQDAGVQDFDPAQLKRLRRMIRTQSGEQNLLELTDSELCLALRLTTTVGDKEYPTLAGLLLLAYEDRLAELVPTARTEFQVLSGTQVVKNESYHKPLLEMIELLADFMRLWNPEREIYDGMQRIPVPEFSVEAFREGLVNALVHRDYSMLGSVRIQITDEGLTISNPGGFIEGVTLENLLTAEPYGRNPLLSDALKRIGLAERTGRGIDRIFAGSIAFGRPWPDYSDSTSKTVSLFIARGAVDEAFVRMLLAEQKRLGHSLSINALLVLSTLKTYRKLRLADLVEYTHVSRARLLPMVELLLEQGLLEELGSGANRYVMLSASVYRRAGKNAEYTRQRGIDESRFAELVLNLAQQNAGIVTKQDIVELLHVTQNTAYKLLKKLCAEGKLELATGGRYARYRVKE